MINFFEYIYNLVVNKNALLESIRYYSFLRSIIRINANVLIPIYFTFTKYNKKHRLSKNTANSELIIVSLTSFPARISRVWLVIESLLHQKRKPDKIILWLSNEQFSNLNSLPKRLLNLRKRGLEIRLCDKDLRSHKKYYYAFQEFPNDYIITVDDDVFYNSNLLAYLLKTKDKYPHTICCNEASFIKITGENIEPYCNWENVVGEHEPNNAMMPIGVGGVLYPPNSLYKDVFNVELFKETCFFADDIWLNIMARLKGTTVSKTDYNSSYLPVMNYNNKALHSINIHEGLNDKQLSKVREYYITNLGIDPYKLVSKTIKINI